MIKVALIGAGKMGISHLSILGAHPDVNIVGVADTQKMVTDVLNKYSGFKTYSDYIKMLDETRPDAVFVATPTKFHTEQVGEVLKRGIHIFAEKPLSVNAADSEYFNRMAKEKGLINQVGYHNKFVATFTEMKRLIKGGYIGDIHHFLGEAYGPVVIRKKGGNWRSEPSEGGGCLMDYASHVIDLVNDIVDPIDKIHGSIMKSIYSSNVEDAIYALAETRKKITGVLSVNWSEETYRKMSTSITVNGSMGKIISDAVELKVFLKTDNCPEGYTKGWNVKYITNLQEEVDFYLRGEEYSAQVDYFIMTLEGKVPNNINTFESASITDAVIDKIRQKNSI